MTTLAHAIGTRLSLPQPLRLLAGVLALTLGSLVAGQQVGDPNSNRIVMAGAALLALVGLGLFAPRRLLFALLLWLAALGLIRRLGSVVAVRGELDPFLAVGPAAVGVLLLAAWERGGFERRTRLANLVLVLGVLIVLSAFNPLQNSLYAGVTGLLFVAVPMAGFWIGRGLGDDRTMESVFKVVAALGVLAAVYGLSQTLAGFRSWDSAWIRDYGYAALDVGGVIRPFGTFSAAGEYATYVAVAFAACVAFGLRRPIFALPALGLLGTAVVLASSRGVIFTLAVALGAMAVARRGLPLGPSIVAGAVAVLLVPLAAQRLAPTVYGESKVDRLLYHQLEGLANPLDPERSTLLVHYRIVRDGFRGAVHEPLGVGVGAITISAQKFDAEGRGTEADPSNMAVALGIPGVLAYAFLFVAGFRKAYEVARRRRDALGLIALATLTVTATQWFNGGNYAVALLPWLVLGWVDRTARDEGELPARTPARTRAAESA